MSNIPPPPPPPPSDLPPTTPFTPTPPPADPRSQVQGPAYGLMVAAAVFVLWVLYMIITTLIGVGGNIMGGNKMMAAASGIWSFLWIAVDLVLAAVIFYGAMQMLKLRNYNMALAAAICALLPCTYCCCFLNLAAGIWALVVLMKPEVKAAFNNSTLPSL